MSITLSETILGGIAIAMGSGLITKLIATRNTVKKDDCVAKQGACMALVTVQLEHIKESNKRLEEGQRVIMKQLLNRAVPVTENHGR